MMSISRSAARLCIFALVLLAFLNVAPVSAAPVLWTANPPSGNDGNPCTFASPCQTLLGIEITAKLDANGQIICAEGTAFGGGFVGIQSMTIDCPGLFLPNGETIQNQLAGSVIRIRHLTFNGQTGATGVSVTGGSGATLVLEDCVFENFNGPTIQISPNGPYTLILKNTRISNNGGAGVIIKPAAGGSVKATFDGVTITNNAGGLKTDTTNGSVTVDIFNSNISDNANNGLVALGGAGGQNMMTVKNDVIASNGQAGIESSGGTAGVLVSNTVLDSNTGGAVLALSNGKIITYQNNNIIGFLGSGFTGTAVPQ